MPLLVRTDFGDKNQTGNSLILEMTNMIKTEKTKICYNECKENPFI